MKRKLLSKNGDYRISNTFVVCFIISLLLWSLPVILRLFFIDVDGIVMHQPAKNSALSIVAHISDHLSKNDRWSVFYLILVNNIKVCVTNIAGGVLLGLVTLVNLVMNGFYTIDVLVNIHNYGMPVSKILKYTLPHSVELSGIWLSGAVGFYIAKILFDLMRDKVSISGRFFKFIGINVFITGLIILLAAFIEAYVTA